MKLIAIVLLFLSAVAFASPREALYSYRAPEPSAVESSPELSNDPNFFAHRPAISKEIFYVGGEYLLWKLDESGVSYVTVKDFPVAIDPTNGGQRASLVGDLERVDFDYSSGARGWVGYRLPPEYWEVEGEYTFYFTNTSSVVHRPPSTFGDLSGTFPEFTRSILVKASSLFDFHYQTARIHLARRFLVANSILLRLFAGIEGAWIHQNWRVVYKGEDGDQTVHQNNWHYDAGGIHIGLDTEWFLAEGFGFFFNTALASLYGSHRVFSSMKPQIFVGAPFNGSLLKIPVLLNLFSLLRESVGEHILSLYT